MDLNLPAVALSGIAPELALTVAALAILLADALLPERVDRWFLPAATSVALVIAAALAIGQWGANELQLGQMIALDGFSIFVKVTLASFGLLAVWLGREYLVKEGLEEAEFYGLMLFAIAGMMLMAAAADLIVMFLALETFSLALYVLVGFRRRSLTGQESAMKYFLLGAFSSAFFLLGIAFVYGAVGSTTFYGTLAPDRHPGIVDFLRTTATGDYGLLVLGTGLLIVGLGFKVAAVPFHAWTPDAYQGAPTPVTGFMAAATKIAAFAAMLRLLDVTLFTLRWDWRPLLIGLAVLTMIVGSALAIVQEDVKRMLAYSSIAHAGFVMTGVIAANDRGVSGSLFYLVTYGLTIIGAFAVVTVLGGRDEKRARLTDYKGLFYERPALAGALTLFMLSLAGVPLTSGFAAKLVVFGAAIQADLAWLVVVGAVASAIAAFFYLRVLVVMYMQEPDSPADPAAEPSTDRWPVSNGIIAFAAMATLALGVYWGPLIDLAGRATLIFDLG